MSPGPRRDDRARPVPGQVAVDQTVAVVGLDGSSTSWDAFWWACGDAQRSDRHVVAVYVSTPSEGNIVTVVPFAGPIVDYAEAQQATTEIAQRLRDAADNYAHDHGLQVTFVHTHGDPARELVRIANSYRADLLVVGKSTKALHHLAGSLGRRLVAKGDTPIVVVVP